MVAQLVVKAVLTAANMALSMSRKIEGPRSETSFTSGDYNAPIPEVFGMRRLQTPIFWAEDLKEVKRRRKTKGGKFNEYTYYGTWAVLLAGHEISAVRRVWFDTHLVFDLTGAGPVTPFSFGGEGPVKAFQRTVATTTGKAGNAYFAIYSGTETQEPDDRMQATVEAKQGEGTCPAYRGVAYIVFKDIPLEKLGNRIPQVSVEFVAQEAALSITTETVPQVHATSPSIMKFSTDFSRMVWLDPQTSGSWPVRYEVWDTAARTLMIGGTIGGIDHAAFNEPFGVYSNGAMMVIGDTSSALYLISGDGLSATLVQTFGALDGQDGVYVLMDRRGIEHWMTTPNLYSQFYLDGTALDFGEQPVHFFADSYGDIWGVFRDSGYATSVTIRKVVDGGAATGFPDVTLSGLPSSLIAGVVYGTHVHSDEGDRWVIKREDAGGNSTFYVIDCASGALVSSYTVPGGAGSAPYENVVWTNIAPGSPSIWVFGDEYSLLTGELLRTGASSAFSGIHVYDPINHAIVIDKSAGLEWNYLDRVANPGVPLQEVVERVCSLAGIPAAEIDATALTATVRGYSAVQGSGKDWLEPLLDLMDVDARPHGFQLQFLPRGGAAGATIANAGFARGGEGEPLYSLPRDGATDVPAKVVLQFADVDADQQANSAMSGPLVVGDGKRETSLDMGTLALTSSEARQLAGRYHRRAIADRIRYSLALPASSIALEPGDVHPVALREVTQTARLASMVLGDDRRIATEWLRDDPSIALLDGAAGAAFDGRNPSVVIVPLISRGFVADVPLLSDGDSSVSPVVYLAAAPYATGAWPGATIYQAVDGEYSEEIADVASSSPATWGYTTGVLSDANPNLWDRGSSVNVRVQTGTLTGTTETVINATPLRNLCLIGRELVNFTTATLEIDGSYTLSGFKRGRRGTEWACAAHAAGDVFLLLDTAEAEALGLSEVGTNLSFKAVTNGRTADSALPVDLVPFSGASLKPYAPCHLRATASGSDWVLGWTRRTRVGGAWTSGTSIPLSEAAEEYEIEIMDGGTVKRTVTGLTSPAWTYLAADQTTDFGAPLTSAPAFRVYQISDAVGRGFAAAA